MARRVADVWHALGWRATLVTPLWLLRPGYLFFTRDLGVAVNVVPTFPDATWRELTPEDAEAVSSLMPGEPPERIQHRLSEGQRGLLCLVQGFLAHCR